MVPLGWCHGCLQWRYFLWWNSRGRIHNRLFTVLYFSVRSPQSHANSEMGAIFVLRAQRTTIHRGGECRGGLDVHHSPELSYSRQPPPRWIVVLSPGCARNINKDGARFVRSWRSYGKIEDCKQSKFITLM